jgi:hypothetical protein
VCPPVSTKRHELFLSLWSFSLKDEVNRLSCDLAVRQSLDGQIPHRFYFSPRVSHGSFGFQNFSTDGRRLITGSIGVTTSPIPLSLPLFGSIICCNSTSIIADPVMASISAGAFPAVDWISEVASDCNDFSVAYYVFVAFLSP